jgi:hypothetical protein
MPDEAPKQIANIPESYFEYRADIKPPMFDAWPPSTHLVSILFPLLNEFGTGLADMSWNKETATFKDFELRFHIPRLTAGVKLSLDAVTCFAINPDWGDAPVLVQFFDRVLETLVKGVPIHVVSQEVSLGLHVRSGDKPFGEKMSELVNSDVVGKASMYGLSIYDDNASIIVDKSLRYAGGVFIRLYRRFDASIPLTDIVTSLYEDEMRALGWLGLKELLGG